MRHQDLQDVLAAARLPAGGKRLIYVADGTYRPAAPNGNRTMSFDVVAGVSIYGGFAGYGASDPYERKPEEYRTVLSGDLKEPVRALADALDMKLVEEA